VSSIGGAPCVLLPLTDGRTAVYDFRPATEWRFGAPTLLEAKPASDVASIPEPSRKDELKHAFDLMLEALEIDAANGAAPLAAE
jgi:hypothetical protein